MIEKNVPHIVKNYIKDEGVDFIVRGRTKWVSDSITYTIVIAYIFILFVIIPFLTQPIINGVVSQITPIIVYSLSILGAIGIYYYCFPHCFIIGTTKRLIFFAYGKFKSYYYDEFTATVITSGDKVGNIILSTNTPAGVLTTTSMQGTKLRQNLYEKIHILGLQDVNFIRLFLEKRLRTT